MKKIAFIILMICFSMMVFGCQKKEDETPNQEEIYKINKKEIIIANLKLLHEGIISEDYNNQKDYKNTANYKTIINLGEEAVPILIDMYNNKEIDEQTSMVITEVIQDISNCNLKEKYNLEWENSQEFFKLWDNINKTDEENLPNLTPDVITLLNKYPDLADAITKSNIKLPELNNMIPQGITLMDDYILITAYDKNGQSSSRCYVLSLKGKLINTVILDTNSHVGGIAYDHINNLLWIPDNDGKLNVYDAQTFLTEKKVTYKYQFTKAGERLKNYENKLKNLIAYLCIKDNKLFVGSFDDKEKGLVKSYEIIKNEEDEIELNYISEFKVPPQVQGIDFYTIDEETYLLLSCSYGRFNPSYLYIYKYDEETLDYGSSIIDKVTLKLPPMLEQITIKSNKLYTLFESKAKEYDNCLEKIGGICLFNLDKIISRWSANEEPVQEESLEGSN